MITPYLSTRSNDPVSMYPMGKTGAELQKWLDASQSFD